MSARPAASLSLLLFLLHGAACEERTMPAQNITRSESSTLSLPHNPSALAALLGVPAESLLAAGQERYGRQAYDSARAIWAVQLERAREQTDSAVQARTLMWLGLAEWRLGDYPAARNHGAQSLALKRRLNLDAELSRSYNALGLLAWNEGRHREALLSFDSAVATSRRNQDLAGVARASANIPLVQVELGQYEAARRGLLTAIEAGRKIGDDRTQANALANLAMLDIRLGDPTGAIPLLDQARRLYRADDYSTGEANALGQLATALSAQGDLQRAIAAADSGLAIARSDGLQQEAASILEVFADLHLQAGSPRLALRSLRQADSLDAVMGLAVERGNNLRRSTVILLELGEGPAAVSPARQALALHQQVEAEEEAIQDRLQLALALRQTGNPKAARAELDTALEQADRVQSPSVKVDAALVAAQVALLDGDPESALRYTDRVPVSLTPTGWRLEDLRAQALLARGKLDEARGAAERAIAALDQERGSLGTGPLRSTYFASRIGPFSRLVAIDLARGDTAAAFEVAASLPGKVLAERLGGLPGGQAGAVQLVVERERLLLRAAALEGELAELSGLGADLERRKAIQRELDADRAAYEEHLAHDALSPSARLLGLASPTLTAVEGRLANDEALLLFLAGPERLDVFAVRRDRVYQQQVGKGSRDLAVKLRVIRELMERSPVDHQAWAALGELHQWLIEPLLRHGAFQGVRRVHIVPHGPLSALPFAALWNRSTGRFLVQDFILDYLPAVAALTDTGPETPGTFRRMAVFAPLPDSLPATEREAKIIQRLLPDAILRLGPAATESGVRAALERGGPVHLASHGSQNRQNPLFSRMIVGRPKGSNPADDGRLELHEILQLESRSPLVFLSGCETGFSGAAEAPFAETMEEGSLAQALLVAGVQTVVATLWRVPDQGAAKMAERFYRELLGSGSSAEALAQAQRQAIGAGEGLSWAAYSVFGTGSRKMSVAVRATEQTP